MCQNIGRFGHYKDGCVEKREKSNACVGNVVEVRKGKEKEIPNHKEDGPWMVVQKSRRYRKRMKVEERRPPRGSTINIVGAPLIINVINSQETLKGSQFIVIDDDVPEIEIVNNDKNVMENYEIIQPLVENDNLVMETQFSMVKKHVEGEKILKQKKKENGCQKFSYWNM